MDKEKRIVVVLGAYPDVGKGVFISSLGYLIQEAGYHVEPYKFDGYMNLSNGTTSPYHVDVTYVHADEELFVMEDGYEANADQGRYERFLNQSISAANLITNGHLFQRLFDVERSGKLGYGAKTSFRVIRKILIEDILSLADTTDFLFLETGGSVGDRESHILYEALNFIQAKRWANVFTILLSPYLAKPGSSGLLSFRTKIIRQGYEGAWRLGLTPDAIVLRGEDDDSTVPIDTKYILAETYLTNDDIFMDPQCEDIHQLPGLLKKQGLDRRILQGFDLEPQPGKSTGRIETYITKLMELRQQPAAVKIAIYGKSGSFDTYVSLLDAIDHAGVELGVRTEIVWLDGQEDYLETLAGVQALIVSESIHFAAEKMQAIQFAREHDLPVLALSFGSDLLVKEFVANVLQQELVVEEIEEGQSDVRIQKMEKETGGQPLELAEDSRLFTLYGNTKSIKERFRHNSFVGEKAGELLSDSALKPVAFNAENRHPVAFECQDKRFYLALKYHPEYLSRPMLPHPVFVEFLKHANI